MELLNELHFPRIDFMEPNSDRLETLTNEEIINKRPDPSKYLGEFNLKTPGITIEEFNYLLNIFLSKIIHKHKEIPITPQLLNEVYSSLIDDANNFYNIDKTPPLSGSLKLSIYNIYDDKNF